MGKLHCGTHLHCLHDSCEIYFTRRAPLQKYANCFWVSIRAGSVQFVFIVALVNTIYQIFFLSLSHFLSVSKCNEFIALISLLCYSYLFCLRKYHTEWKEEEEVFVTNIVMEIPKILLLVETIYMEITFLQSTQKEVSITRIYRCSLTKIKNYKATTKENWNKLKLYYNYKTVHLLQLIFR